MFSNESVYPEWVRQYKTKGTVIKKVNDSYYLYKRTSKRVEGKKYPQAVDKYIGVITKDGVKNALSKKISLEAKCIVKEYGLSKTLQSTVPDVWKKIAGDNWNQILYLLIDHYIDNSYLPYEVTMPGRDNNRNYTPAQWNSLFRHLKDIYGVSKDELMSLKNIYKVYMDGKTFISYISDDQKAILNRLSIDLEVS